MTILITGSLCWWLIALCMILNNNNGDSICLKLIAVFTLLDVVFLIYSVISHVQFLVWVPLWGRTWGGGTLLCGCCRAVKIAVFFGFTPFSVCTVTDVWLWFGSDVVIRGREDSEVPFFCLFWCVFLSLYSFSFLYLQYLFRVSLIIMLMKICSDRTYLLWLSSEPLNSLYQSSFCRLTPFKLFFFCSSLAIAIVNSPANRTRPKPTNGRIQRWNITVKSNKWIKIHF